jgi:hypothetical protein
LWSGLVGIGVVVGVGLVGDEDTVRPPAIADRVFDMIFRFVDD